MIQYLNLPPIPTRLLDEFEERSGLCPNMEDNFVKTSEHCQGITDWCRENVCPDLFYGVQIMQGMVPKHTDRSHSNLVPECKLVYLVDPGGANVKTRFWDGDMPLREFIIEPLRWHLIQVNVVHSVEGIENNRKRWGVTTQMLHKELI
jgi:hypothetical protein